MRPVLFVLVCLVPLHAWANWLENGEVLTQIGYGHGSYANTRLAATLEIAPSLDIAIGETVTATVSARIRGDERDWYQPGTPDLSNYRGASRPRTMGDHWLAELRDAYVEVGLNNGTLRLGKQQIVWGALDGLKVLDQLNPQSYERFILERFDQSRIGLWSAYADLSSDAGRIELALIPDTTTHYIPGTGAWFELTAPRFRFGQTDPAAAVPVIHREPDDSRGTVGLRFSRYLGGVDVQLVALSGLEFEPLGRLASTNGEAVIETYHERRHLFGIGAETSFSSFVVRGELSHTPNRVFNTRTHHRLDRVRLPHWRGGIGIDWNAPLDLFVNLQYIHDHVVSATPALVRERDERFVTAFVKRRFLYDTLDMELRWYSSLEEQDQLFRLLLAYQLSDRTTIEFAVDEFKGAVHGVFGQFEQRDQITLSLQHSF